MRFEHKCFRGLQFMKPESLDRSHMSNVFAYSAVIFIVFSLYRTPPISMQGINHTWLHFANSYFKVTILQGLKNSFLTDDDFYTYFLPMHNLAHIEFALRDSQHRFWSCTASTAQSHSPWSRLKPCSLCVHIALHFTLQFFSPSDIKPKFFKVLENFAIQF